jgi:hypothetical protein
MKRFIKILEKTLEETGAIGPLFLGEEDSINATEKDKERVLAQLKEELSFINKMIIAIIVLHFLLFALAVFFALYFRDSPTTITLLLGGSLLGLMVIINSLIRLVKIRNAIGLLQITFPYLSPKEAMALIRSIYYDAKKNKWF